jgi:hypothetical protein
VIGEGDKSNGAYQWMSDGSSTASSSTSPAVRPGCGWPLAAPPGAGSSPENFGKVTVASGATLKGDGECTISSLRIDAANGAGTIDGFKFAESGTLEIVNYEKTSAAVELGLVFANAEGVGNLAKWTLNGANLGGRKLYLRNGKLAIVPDGLTVIVK